VQNHYILFYDYVEDMAERRGPYREEHLERIRAARDQGQVVMAGALGQPPRGAAIVFRDVEPERIETFVHEDPYVKAGLVTGWRIERWSLV
jgi:uncharacterized protein